MDKNNNNETAMKNRHETLLEGENAAYLELLLESYLDDPSSVSESWQQYFSDLPLSAEFNKNESHSKIRQEFKTNRLHSSHAHAYQRENVSAEDLETERQQVQILQMIDNYRTLGHLVADTNPLNEKAVIPSLPELSLQYYGLDNVDKNKWFDPGSFQMALPPTLENIYRALRSTYTESIGVEYMHIMSTEEKSWVQSRIEPVMASPDFSVEKKSKLLDDLIAAETLERYLHNKYVGQKRFSLEGGESLIPLLREIIHHSGSQKTREMILAMAHRGRLNVLINIMGKSPDSLFKEFEDNVINDSDTINLAGDVKYHKGYSCSIQTSQDPMHLSLAFNPSHLEIVGPVASGSVRARQDRRDDQGGQVIGVVIHGDAAFAGQGVVMESFNMAQTRGYRIHGTVHIVINNQIGFTTSTQVDSRSTFYPTDVAKMVNALILHVNGDDPEAVLFVAQLALDYRLRFKKDVVIDLVCYRRHGHNEADEPAMTQPIMYTAIRNKKTLPTLYAERLEQAGGVSQNDFKERIDTFKKRLSQGLPAVDILEYSSVPEHFRVSWDAYKGREWTTKADTRFNQQKLQQLVKRFHAYPDDKFVLHKRVEKIIQQRNEMAETKRSLDWGFAETLAYATLLSEGFNIRLSGQDSGRGTFSHRHAVLHNQLERQAWIPLKHVAKDQGTFNVIDSVLSEEAVLAFEYGYATSSPNTLVIWEAQFGDFANGAQVVIDQFISSGEQKWGRLCGLTLFLPHGYEGMGAEHSSARLERYMQLCAEKNMQVCVPSTPAQVYHMLRRQMIRQYRRPLIVMTPKSLLRKPEAVSELRELTEGSFKTIIDDERVLKNKARITRVILCSGKVYYDLLETTNSEQLSHVALIRIEQLYPFPSKLLEQILLTYPKLKELIWCQEEPRNQGAWDSTKHRFRLYEDRYRVMCVSRPAAAAPAVGSHKVHHKQQTDLVLEALGLYVNKLNPDILKEKK